MHYIAGGAVLVNTIGVGPIVQCLTALTSSTQIICGTIGNIVVSEKVDSQSIVNLIKELDLSTEMIILQSLLKEIRVEQYESSETLKLCLNALRECISSVQNNLNETYERITYNNSLWIFKFYRSYVFDDLMTKLIISKKALDNRKKLLFETLNMYSSKTILPNNIDKDIQTDNNHEPEHNKETCEMELYQNYSK